MGFIIFTKTGVAMDYLDWIPTRITELRMQKGVSARDMSLSLGQCDSYINRIENHRALPSMAGLIYICEYFNITPQEFFNAGALAPQKSKELLSEMEKLTAAQADHLITIIHDITGQK